MSKNVKTLAVVTWVSGWTDEVVLHACVVANLMSHKLEANEFYPLTKFGYNEQSDTANTQL